MTDVEKVARAIMMARSDGDCIVKDWRAEMENPHVATAYAQSSPPDHLGSGAHPMTNPREIAAKLTEAQRAAVCGRYAWKSPIDEEQGEVALYQLGLWSPRPKYGEKAITPLGLAVRAEIEKELQ